MVQPQAPDATPTPNPYATAPAGAAQGLSIASLVCGVAGVVLAFVWLGFLPALAAVILGHIGLKRQPHAKPFWLTGLIMGYVGAAIGLVQGLVVLAIAIPFLLILIAGGS